VIRVNQLVKSFGGKRVLAGVDLEVDKGESFALLGRSGCGKSVLLKILLGLMMPDGGSIEVEGKSIVELSVKERNRLRLRIGMLFQGVALFDSLSVEENIAFSLTEHTKMTSKEMAVRVAECLEMVGLKGIEDRRPIELSGGMRKRVGLARAIAMKPEILLYDEPTTGLDPITADSINNLMVQLKKVLKVTSILVTHDMASVFLVADRMGLLHNGRIRQTGSPVKMKRSPDPVVRAFIRGTQTP